MDAAEFIHRLPRFQTWIASADKFLEVLTDAFENEATREHLHFFLDCCRDERRRALVFQPLQAAKREQELKAQLEDAKFTLIPYSRDEKTRPRSTTVGRTKSSSALGRAKSHSTSSSSAAKASRHPRPKSAPPGRKQRGAMTGRQNTTLSKAKTGPETEPVMNPCIESPLQWSEYPEMTALEPCHEVAEMELLDLPVSEPESLSIEVSQLSFCSKQLDATITIKFPIGNRLWPEGATAACTLHSDTNRHPDQEEAITKLWMDLSDSFPGAHRLCFWMIPGLAAVYPRQFSFHAAAAARHFAELWKCNLARGENFRRAVYNSLQFYMITFNDSQHAEINERNMHVINSLNNYRSQYPQNASLRWLREDVYDVVAAKAAAWLKSKYSEQEAAKRIRALLPFEDFQSQIFAPLRRLRFSSKGYLTGGQLAPHDPDRRKLSRLPSSLAGSRRRNNTADGKVQFLH